MGMATKQEHTRWNWINSFSYSTSSGLISAIFIVFVLFVGISSATPLSISGLSLSLSLSIHRLFGLDSDLAWDYDDILVPFGLL